MSDARALFPVPLAIRLLLDSVSYSNALPDWVHPLVIDYNGREDRVTEALNRYLAGEMPEKAMEVPVPKKDGTFNVWLTPSVNDQIALQACVSAVAQDIEQKYLDKDRVFSCRLNTDPTRLAFLNNQVDGWKQFNLRVYDRCASDRCVLQFDIKSAYESIKFDSFSNFLHRATNGHPASNAIEGLLKTFSGSRGGLPFINDSVFFLGNAYFSEVDNLLRAHNYEFVRFVDDYRVFGNSPADLEAILAEIRPELRAAGFEINEGKLKLGTGEEYLQAMANIKYAESSATDYHDASVQMDIYNPKGLLEQVLLCLGSPSERLHDGFGRMLLGSLRAMHFRTAFAREQGAEQELTLENDDYADPEDAFYGLLSNDPEALKLVAERLEEYSRSPKDIWRLIWVLYVCRDLRKDKIKDTALQSRIFNSIEAIQTSKAIDLIGRLWAQQVTKTRKSEETISLIEKIHGLGYQDAGSIWNGSQTDQ
jgi:hypothetical protein